MNGLRLLQLITPPSYSGVRLKLGRLLRRPD